jgi:hypothetical protein
MKLHNADIFQKPMQVGHLDEDVIAIGKGIPYQNSILSHISMCIEITLGY